MSTPLACPKCHSTALRSDEVAAIGYSVTLARSADDTIEVTYTGDTREVWDEGTEYSADLWCRDCGAKLTEADLITEPTDEDSP